MACNDQPKGGAALALLECDCILDKNDRPYLHQHLSGGGVVATQQPMPTRNDRPACWDMVISDMGQRDYTGFRRYNTRLQPFNGRDALRDAYEECLDMAVYLRQALFERDGK